MSNNEYNPIIEFQQIDAFAKEMKKKIKENAHKGSSWEDCDLWYLYNGIKRELREYRRAIGLDAKRKELVDVANFCMFLWSRLVEK